MIFVMAALAGPAVCAGQTPDEAEIRKVELGLQQAWNRHDMKAWANAFTVDADFVNVVGWWGRGRAEIEKKHADAHAFAFRESTLTIEEVHTRFLAPEFAVVHVLWTLVGHKKGIFTQVLQKRDGKWLIAAAQNTDRRPEVPMPTALPK
jgi:uncharacterized protein (TIGR02246 family)